MTVTNGRDTLDFFDMWFRPEHFSVDHTVAAVNNTRADCLTLGLSPIEWVQNLSSDGDPNKTADDIRSAFHGLVKVYPWFLLPGSAQLGLMREDSILGRRNRMPGFYVDIIGGIGREDTESVLGFATILGTVGIGPTLITKEHTGNERWRFWWRMDDPFDAIPEVFRLADESDARRAHLAWSAIIQHHAIKSGFASVLNFNPRFRQLRPSPRSTIVGIEERMADLALLRRNYRPLVDGSFTFPAETEPPWDWVLGPLGWRSLGHGHRLDVDHWRSPGGETFAATEGAELRLDYKHSWSCGLKEVSDAGIYLNKLVVACVLGWDGECEAFVDHWAKTLTLYE